MTKEVNYDAYNIRATLRFLFKAVIFNLGLLPPKGLRVDILRTQLYCITFAQFAFWLGSLRYSALL